MNGGITMGLMDKVKDTVKSADEKIGNAIDKEKIDSDIRGEERKIEGYTKDLGEKVLASLRKGEPIAEDALKGIYDDILACEAKIEDLKKDKEALKSK